MQPIVIAGRPAAILPTFTPGGFTHPSLDCLGPVPNARMKAMSGSTTVRWQADASLREPGTSLPEPGDAIESLERPTMVVGAISPGKRRIVSLVDDMQYATQSVS